MYGVVASQKEPRERRASRPTRAQNKVKRVGFGERILDYLKKRINPPVDDEEQCVERLCQAQSRRRPEQLSTLVTNTRFTQHEIKVMYRGFKQECPSGLVDEESFKHIFSQFFPLGDANPYAQLVFNAIKHKQSGNINFEEFLRALSIAARGSLQEKVSFVFGIYDRDGDGRVTRDEMIAVVSAIYSLVGESVAPPVQPASAADHVDRLFHLMDADGDGAVSLQELVRWCSEQPLRDALDNFDTSI